MAKPSIAPSSGSLTSVSSWRTHAPVLAPPCPRASAASTQICRSKPYCVARAQRAIRSPAGILSCGMVPASAQVVGAGEADVLVARVVEIEEGLVLRVADVDAGVEHLLAVVVAGLRVAVGAEREDAEGHLGVVEACAPGPDHFREDVAVHVGAGRAVEGVVVALVEDRALDRESGDRRDHARVAVAGEVVVPSRPGPQVAGLLSRSAGIGLPSFVCLSIHWRCCAMRFSRSACGSHAATSRSHSASLALIGSLSIARSTGSGVQVSTVVPPREASITPIGHVAGHVDAAGEDVADRRELADDLGRADVPVALAEMPAEPAAPLVQAGEALLQLRALT